MVLGRFMTLRLRYSARTHVATQTAVSNSARGPNMTTDAMSAGSRAISTSRISLGVVTGLCR